MSIGSRLTIFNTLLNLIFFYFLSFIFGIDINLSFIILIFGIFIIYYIFNIYNMEKGKYQFSDLLYSFFLNLLLVIVALLVNMKELAFVFIDIFILQNIIKYFLAKFFVKKNNVIIIGKNKESEVIKRIINEKDIYNVVAELNFQEIENIEELVEKYDVERIIITENIIKESLIQKILSVKLKGVKTYNYINFFEKVEEKVLVNRINEEWFLFGRGFNILHDNFQKRLKRIFDFLLAILIFILTFPIMLVSAVIIKLESKGPILFIQERIGLGNKSFKIVKFRSMTVDAEKNGPQWAQKKDNRVTKFGKFMRKTRIDELPQLWNVIKGEMSFIGPRPERKYFIDILEKEIPYYNVRHSVKPGLTGWAQVKYPYGASVEDALRKLEYDLFYIKHQNFIFDIIIIFKTVKTVVFGKGR
ncbi:exopolysaccharide biosynthesis polyprenyl glycosylphosphotransferase [Hypnocyclicus thermotrophus]|uniref:Exopolysaccharide biosynthesis polyprenyl glycosylphosphotransferase n=1 Tax=Hypnocyclicus thermotrophus TaxID=1627895 RepID=A0AA46I4W1_9FUSO|nr:exopolysaccharide biosynthesis polyprenyl glycosylphosphotransferase [Hypnocyclicus thermotrophus]TDT67862.1 exopolysaccharide biosynthesis polyprenyl glycosylphosphotransferase [Hypnocyclicus thermotrophus]